jgi:23S rRNA pseudouridine955/2504/2580 synthase
MQTSDDGIRILHRDHDVLVLYKPPHLPTTSPGKEASLASLAPGFDREAPLLHPTSRLDAPVSGIVTFARSRESIATLLQWRRQGLYRRVYVAIARAVPVPSSGLWQAALEIDPRDARKRRVSDARQPGRGVKQAATDYAVMQNAEGACVLHLWPRTGRTHQLRVHCAAAGSPLLGDVSYGGIKRVVRPDGRVVTASRVMLHCAGVALPADRNGERALAVTCDVPPDMALVWSQLSNGAPWVAPLLDPSGL